MNGLALLVCCSVSLNLVLLWHIRDLYTRVPKRAKNGRFEKK